MKLAISLRHVSENFCKGFQGQKSKVKVIARLLPAEDTHLRTTVRPLSMRRRHGVGSRVTCCRNK